jgi:predicted GIY-YIG superfamily endonuclease
MPVLERRSPPLFKLLETSLIVAFPQYEASLPQDIDLTGKKVYLIHLEKPLKHAKHYLGFSEDIQERVKQHRNGRGAAFMKAIKKNGISWYVSRIWDGDRELERILKNQHNASHLCPTCIQERIYKKTLSIEVDPITHETRGAITNVV